MDKKLPVAFAFLLTAFYALLIIDRPTICPEFCATFTELTSVQGWKDVFREFVHFNDFWYRPFTFRLTNYTFFRLVDFHNIYAVKSIGVAIIVFSAFVTAKLAAKILHAGVAEQALVFALLLTHPVYISIAYDGSGLVDPFFNIFINLFLLCLLPLMEELHPRTMPPSTLGPRQRASLVGLAVLCVLGILTSHERGTSVFLMAGALYIYYHFDEFRHFKPRLFTAVTVLLTLCVIMCAAYLWLVYMPRKQWTGEDYRTAFEPDFIRRNLARAFEWPLWLDFQKTDRFYDAHLNSLFNLMGAPLLLAMLWQTLRVLLRGEKAERSGVIILLILFFCSLPTPVYFGGNTWHFYTASMYVSILTGHALWRIIETYLSSSRERATALAACFSWLAIAFTIDIGQELDPSKIRYAEYLQVTQEALTDPVLHSFPDVPQVVFFDITSSHQDGNWQYGAGNLFRFVYTKPDIVEIPLLEGKIYKGFGDKCKEAKGKSFIAVSFDKSTMSWRRIEQKDYCAS